jgi:hypothetical protein
MILKLLRVSMHPWLWFTVARQAVVRNTDSQSVERRQAAANILDAIAGLFDPDNPNITSPYSQLSSWDLQRIDGANERLRAEHGDNYRSHPDFRPLPAPLSRRELDFPSGEISFLKESIEKLARSPDVPNDMARPMLDALGAVTSAKGVEIDTEQGKPTS